MPPGPSAAPVPKPPDQRLGRRRRLVASRLFDQAYEQRRKFVGRFMLLFLRSGEGASLRLGVVTGRKVGAAHVRTKSRRRLREVFRRNRERLRGRYDVVLIARAGVDRAPWGEVVKDFLALAGRAGILSDE